MSMRHFMFISLNVYNVNPHFSFFQIDNFTWLANQSRQLIRKLNVP